MTLKSYLVSPYWWRCQCQCCERILVIHSFGQVEYQRLLNGCHIHLRFHAIAGGTAVGCGENVLMCSPTVINELKTVSVASVPLCRWGHLDEHQLKNFSESRFCLSTRNPRNEMHGMNWNFLESSSTVYACTSHRSAYSSLKINWNVLQLSHHIHRMKGRGKNADRQLTLRPFVAQFVFMRSNDSQVTIQMPRHSARAQISGNLFSFSPQECHCNRQNALELLPLSALEVFKWKKMENDSRKLKAKNKTKK